MTGPKDTSAKDNIFALLNFFVIEFPISNRLKVVFYSQDITI